MFKSSLFWFQNDLRVQDNPALMQAASQSERLLCLVIIDPSQFRPGRYSTKALGAARWQFLQQSITDLQATLATQGQQLLIRVGQPMQVMAELITEVGMDAVFSSYHPGHYERHRWELLQQRYPYLHWQQAHSNTLFDAAELPFSINELPDSFSKFRRKVEGLTVPTATAAAKLPPPPGNLRLANDVTPTTARLDNGFSGGERAAHEHLQSYFSQAHASEYKEVRNELDGWRNSTKFSAWLATGCVSPRRVYDYLKAYEQRAGANDSTYWIYFELLWREYFHWYGYRYGQRLFAFGGIKQSSPSTSFYPTRFQKWCSGNTPYPIVNACMKQLNATGFMSNRGRQLVASCLVNELELDWRYGAAYFEQQLVDYDVASNWGNWQYLAGVGADPSGKRWFDLAKQTQLYDPQHTFIERWQGQQHSMPLDDVDAADWPVSE